MRQPGDWAVLGAVAEQPRHGFGVAQLLSPDGALGQVWAMPRPLVYQALKRLLADGMVEEVRVEAGTRGPRRTVLAATPAGKRALRAWLAEPVLHVRDARSQLLLKLALASRAGRDQRALLQAQRRLLSDQVGALERQHATEGGFERTLTLWRLESSRAALRFVGELLAGGR
ncbi:MAG: PadR family transcriptional regulator [Acidimicrobiales bacterium]